MRTRSSERFVCLWTRVETRIRSDDQADIEPSNREVPEPRARRSEPGRGEGEPGRGRAAAEPIVRRPTTTRSGANRDPSHAGERGPGSGDRGATLHPSRLAQPCEPGPGPSPRVRLRFSTPRARPRGPASRAWVDRARITACELTRHAERTARRCQTALADTGDTARGVQ